MVTHTVRGGASLRVACARERFSQSQWTGATSLLPAERIEEGMRAEGITPYRCLYTPLYQKLASELTVRGGACASGGQGILGQDAGGSDDAVGIPKRG